MRDQHVQPDQRAAQPAMSQLLENQLAETLSLDGAWEAEVGGVRGTAHVPGVWERHGFPADVERAVYRRRFNVPAAWAGRAVRLRFGGVSYAVEAAVNGQHVGRHEGMWAAFEFDVSAALRYGEDNTIELQIIKPLNDGDTYPYREVLVGFIPYIATTFGGLWQSVALIAHAHPALSVDGVRADWQTGVVSARVGIHGDAASADTLAVDVIDSAGQVVAGSRHAAAALAVQVAVPEWRLWSHVAPVCYRLRLRLLRDEVVVAETGRTVGFRALHADDERLLLNGEAVSLRGLLSWGWKPSTLAPLPTDDEIRDEFRRARMMGFNLIKLCLFVPPQRVFEIADEEGMLLWLELPMWWQRITPHLRQQAAIEYADIMRAVHHHPSVIIYSLGCELGADMADAEMLSGLNALVRGAVGGVLVCDNSGSGEAYAGLTFDYADFLDYHFYSDLHYFNPLLDHFRRDWREPRPWIFGEYCDSDTYRDVRELYENGEPPWWLDVYGVEGNPTRWAYAGQLERMAAHRLPFDDSQLKAISEQQSFVVRKTILERSRARGGIGGYVLTGLRDSPISTSGVFDDLDRPKADPAAFTQFNADNVLLLEGGRTRDWVHGGDRPAPRDLFNHTGGSVASFRLLLAQTTLGSGARGLTVRLVRPDGQVMWSETNRVTLPPAGVPREIVAFDLPLPTVSEAAQWTLEAALDGGVRNEWPLWLYPQVDAATLPVTAYDPLGAFDGLWPAADLDGDASGVVIASFYNGALRQYVEAGGRAVVLQPHAGPLPTGAVPFWREAIKLLYDHPLLARFPHEGYTNLQFYHLATDRAFTPDVLPGAVVTPVIQRLDARLFTLAHYLVDARIGQGTLLATTLRLFGGAGDQVRGLQANPAGRWLLKLMVDWLAKAAGGAATRTD